MARDNQFDDLPKERSQGTIERNKRILDIILAIVSIVFIVVLCGMNYVKPLDKVYSPEAFYLGAHPVTDREDPLSTYNQMTGNNLSGADGACKTKFLTLSADKLLTWKSGGNAMPCILSNNKGFDPNNISTWVEQFTGETLGIDGNDNRWYFWNDATESTDMRIIAPWKSFKFRNSNFANDGKIMVSATLNNDVIAFVGIENWYCHMDMNKKCKQHTVKIGNVSTDSTLRGFSSLSEEFTILGKATKDTYMVGMKQDDSGTWVECSPAEVLGIK